MVLFVHNHSWQTWQSDHSDRIRIKPFGSDFFGSFFSSVVVGPDQIRIIPDIVRIRLIRIRFRSGYWQFGSLRIRIFFGSRSFGSNRFGFRPFRSSNFGFGSGKNSSESSDQFRFGYYSDRIRIIFESIIYGLYYWFGEVSGQSNRIQTQLNYDLRFFLIKFFSSVIFGFI